MGVTSNCTSNVLETKWRLLKETVVGLTDDALKDIYSAKLVEVKSGFSQGEMKVVVNLCAEPGEAMPAFWFKADYTLINAASDGASLDPESLRFYYIVAEDEDAEYPLGQQAKEFLSNYDEKTQKALIKLSEKHPVILVITGKEK